MQEKSIYMGGPVSVETGAKGEIANARLIQHSQKFEQKLYKICDGVYNLVGYGMANATLIEGQTGLIIVDTGDSVQMAQQHLGEFRQVSDKPVETLIYSHNHYALGARAYVPQGQEDEFPIWGHESLHPLVASQLGELGAAIFRRAWIQFGLYLPFTGADAMPNLGVGPYFFDPSHGIPVQGYLKPTRTFGEQVETVIDGVHVRLLHAPADSDDSLIVWLPDKKVAIQNNLHPALFNIYPLRGATFRNPSILLKGLDALRALEPDYLLGVHGPPILGQEKIYQLLTDYRDAIQYLYDQTVRGINRGLDPGQLAESVQLPQHLAASPVNQEFYGEASYHVRQIYAGLMGWFGNDAATLHPVSRTFEAQRLVALAGGAQNMAEAARAALAEGEYSWAAQLAGYLVCIEPANEAYRQLKADALRQIGQVTPAATTRAWALSLALELEGEIDTHYLPVNIVNASAILQTPPGTFVNMLRFALDPVKSKDVDVVFGVRFSDLERGYGLAVRRGVAEYIDHYPGRAELGIALPRSTWAQLLLQETTLSKAQDVEYTGSKPRVWAFFDMFDTL